jgi:hypothetical protein
MTRTDHAFRPPQSGHAKHSDSTMPQGTVAPPRAALRLLLVIALTMASVGRSGDQSIFTKPAHNPLVSKLLFVTKNRRIGAPGAWSGRGVGCWRPSMVELFISWSA